MLLEFFGENIPGSVLSKKEMGNVTGLEFLNKIFFISDGIMLSQVRDITGVDGSTLQNWVKRGWVANTVNKKYTKDHLARILIINMLHGTMRLERIDYLLRYINGSVQSEEDDIVSESQLYDYICRILGRLSERGGDDLPLADFIKVYTSDYTENTPGARRRLEKALEIIVVCFCASSAKALCDRLYSEL